MHLESGKNISKNSKKVPLGEDLKENEETFIEDNREQYPGIAIDIQFRSRRAIHTNVLFRSSRTTTSGNVSRDIQSDKHSEVLRLKSQLEASHRRYSLQDIELDKTQAKLNEFHITLEEIKRVVVASNRDAKKFAVGLVSDATNPGNFYSQILLDYVTGTIDDGFVFKPSRFPEPLFRG